MPAIQAQTNGSTRCPDPYIYRLRDLIYQMAGIFQPDNKLRSLEERCQGRMLELGVKTLRDYFECLTIKPLRQAELVKLLNEITIGETCFFRNRPQLDALHNLVLPQIIEGRSKMALRHLRFWSAGCSTGEEPYTLAMILSDNAAGLLKGWTFEVLATDLNERSLEHAESAVYGDYSVRNVTPHLRQKYFVAQGDRLQVNALIKAKVSFSRLNLVDHARMNSIKNMDVIFCCNLLIYFDLVSKRQVVQEFHNNLLPHGYLFLGHSESLYGVTDDFRLMHLPLATAYVKTNKSKPLDR